MVEILAQTATGTSNLASTSVVFSSNNVGGNSIIVACGNTSGTASDVSGVTDTQGNVYIKILATANVLLGELELWYTSGIKAGANTITVAYTTGVACAVIAREYYGTIYANTVDKSASNTGNSTSLSSGATTPITQNIELIVGAGVIPLADTFTAGAGFVNLTTLAAPLTIVMAMEDLYVISGGSQPATFSSNAIAQWVCGVATFFLLPTGTTTSTSSTSASTFSTSSTSSSISSTSSSISSTSRSTSTSSTSTSLSITTLSTSSTSSSTSSTSTSSTSTSTSISSTSTSATTFSTSSTSTSSTSSSTSISSTSTSFSSTSSSISSTSSSVSSTSFSSTSSSSSTSTTTIPSNLDFDYVDSASFTNILQFTVTSPMTWLCPAGVTSVLVQCWGAGGGAGGSNGTTGGSGGGGGGFSSSTISVTPGTSYPLQVGVGGAGGISAAGSNGTDTWFNNTSTVLAKAGTGGGASGAAAGTGGSSSIGVGTNTQSGGNGFAGSASPAGGAGGGGAGPNQDGITASSSAATNGISLYGGGGGAGTINGTLKPGNPFGGGGGGTGTGTTGGSGAGGGIQLTYTTSGLSLTGADLNNDLTPVQVSQVNGDDGDYFIQRGSEYTAMHFQRKGINNTSNINVSWKGRTTISTLISPFYLQIFNQNSLAWETIASQTLVPADTDFVINASQTTNLSNYYDSNNQVTFRSYQQVI